ncbi:MAG: bifunctional phosphoribosylaminoimidazolecarboxamide formyltransferase/IMP cyclohydrolase [Deltaproteobacteria bacterium]|nr:bifunctional phosphoribosylaminoimidazolecarboxamide formyltransferase/IMP cyclohydrolase [Deltaproteobacteria bacterium]
MGRIRRALLSVSDKRGLVELAQGLKRHDVEILSTGGTARSMEEAGIDVVPISVYTGAPEILDGRVKTLHPKIHGGLLGRDTPEHREQMASQGIEPIDLVVVNLYPFQKTVAIPGVGMEEAIENIDIGGPSMLRSAAKNHERVAVVCDPDDYAAILAEMDRNEGSLARGTRFRLARKAFARTAAYDAAIAAYLSSISEDDSGPAAEFPEYLTLQWYRERSLRYGENPHQRAAFYRDPTPQPEPSVATAAVLQGKELSYNNLLDLDAALDLVLEFPEPAAAIIKHNNPCGVAVAAGGVAEAFRLARQTDPVSAFGGIVAVNRVVGLDLAGELSDIFLECVIAPDFRPEAREALAKKKNLRLLAFGEKNTEPGKGGWSLRSVTGGLLVESRDRQIVSAAEADVVSRRAPTPEELLALEFAWKVCKHVRSNAIVFVRDGQTVGIGAGQMSRVDSARLAATKALSSLKGTVAASDGFFPFRDGVDEIAKAGATAIIQPGGSVRDAEVVAAADEHGLAMLVTKMRHFRH